MREFKFRSWSEGDKSMTTPEDFPVWSILELAIKFNDTIMQYTGLKDKNGIEIYEGDILKLEDATAKVVFWEQPPAFGLDFYHNENKWCEDWNLTDDVDRMEVIGNIYEHPELLSQA